LIAIQFSIENNQKETQAIINMHFEWFFKVFKFNISASYPKNWLLLLITPNSVVNFSFSSMYPILCEYGVLILRCLSCFWRVESIDKVFLTGTQASTIRGSILKMSVTSVEEGKAGVGPFYPYTLQHFF
jgi:hypothetical protein